MGQRRRRRLGLRARVTVIYSLGALLLSSMVAVGAYTITRARLVSEAEEAAEIQAFRNAIDLRQRLNAIPPEQLDSSTVEEPTVSDAPRDLTDNEASAASDASTTTEAPVVDVDEVRENIEGTPDLTITDPNSTDPNSTGSPSSPDDAEDEELDPVEPVPVSDTIAILLESLVTRDGVNPILVINGDDRSLTGARETQIPFGLRELVRAGSTAKQRYVFDDVPQLVVGTPLVGQSAQYYEITTLAELESTLGSLQRILAGTALAAIAAGAALGSYSARRALQPLTDVSAAAESIADGQFDTRLDGHADPDLAGLTSSFNDMVDALETRIERDSRFASDVSHELRSPLMTLAASVGVLQGRREDLPPSAQKAVDLLSHDVHRFEGLVEDLLEISRMDLGASDLDLGPVFLHDFLQFVVSQSRSPEVPVEHRPEDAELVITADKRRLAQAVTNLLDNAVKYADGPSAVSFRRRGDRVNIYVDDLGAGVRPEDRERIFDRFTRAGSDAGRRSQVGGVGLGLSLVTEHLRLHDGTVSVTDRPDGRSGARFVIDLPVGEQINIDEEMAT